MSVVVLGLSHHTAPVHIRERFAFAEASIPKILAGLRQDGLAQEAVILSTCNRVEIYAAAEQFGLDHTAALKRFLLASRQITEPLDKELYFYAEPQSLMHLFRVACGLDSMVLGETEILGQLKQAYDLARQNQHTGRQLNRAFQRAFNVAKQVRTETCIQRGSISVASAAVELAEKIFSTLRHRQVMVIGAGDTSEKTARALLSRGADRVIVTNRTLAKAEALAQALGGEAVAFEAWEQAFTRIDIAISSTAAPHYILDRTRLEPLMKLRHQRDLLLIDIAVPRDIDPEVIHMDNVFLFNIDDLQAIADDYLHQRQEEITRCEGIIAQKVQELMASYEAARQYLSGRSDAQSQEK